MKIGTYEVSVLDKDRVKIGCQEVSRAQLQDILKEMDSPKDFRVVLPHSDERGVHLQLNGEVDFTVKDSLGKSFAGKTLHMSFMRNGRCIHGLLNVLARESRSAK